VRDLGHYGAASLYHNRDHTHTKYMIPVRGLGVYHALCTMLNFMTQYILVEQKDPPASQMGLRLTVARGA
jgi:hypothetical protein